MSTKWEILKQISIIKTIYFNLKYFPLYEAIKLPVFIAKRTILRRLKGCIKIDSPIKTGLIKLGFVYVGLYDSRLAKSLWESSPSSVTIFHGRAYLGSGVKISVCGGTLEVGDNFSITANSSVICKNKITLGRDSLISWDTMIMDTDFHKIMKDNIHVNEDGDIIVGDSCWIGCKSLILKGAIIPNNTVIGAGSIVTKSLSASNAVYYGNPIALKQENIEWQR